MENQPEINAEYIDQLLSYRPERDKSSVPSSSQPAPEPLTEFAPTRRSTPPAKPKKRPRKMLIYALAAVLVIAALCLILPNPIANLRSGYWQARSAEAYDELMSAAKPLYITLCRSYERESGVSESTMSRWQHGNDYLTIETKGEKATYRLKKDNQSFSKTVSQSNPDAKWKRSDIFISPNSTPQVSFSDLDLTFSSIQATLFRINVTFTGESSSGTTQTICFRFNPFGKMLGIDETMANSYMSRQEKLTILSTNPEKIKAAIQKAYEEATQ